MWGLLLVLLLQVRCESLDECRFSLRQVSGEKNDVARAQQWFKGRGDLPGGFYGAGSSMQHGGLVSIVRLPRGASDAVPVVIAVSISVMVSDHCAGLGHLFGGRPRRR